MFIIRLITGGGGGGAFFQNQILDSKFIRERHLLYFYTLHYTFRWFPIEKRHCL